MDTRSAPYFQVSDLVRSIRNLCIESRRTDALSSCTSWEEAFLSRAGITRGKLYRLELGVQKEVVFQVRAVFAEVSERLRTGRTISSVLVRPFSPTRRSMRAAAHVDARTAAIRRRHPLERAQRLPARFDSLRHLRRLRRQPHRTVRFVAVARGRRRPAARRPAVIREAHDGRRGAVRRRAEDGRGALQDAVNRSAGAGGLERPSAALQRLQRGARPAASPRRSPNRASSSPLAFLALFPPQRVRPDVFSPARSDPSSSTPWRTLS